MTAPAMLARRSTSVVLLAAGGGLTLLGSAQPWARLTLTEGLTPTSIAVTGSALAPLSVAAAAVGLAGVLAVLSARTWGRRIVGTVTAVLAVAALVQTLTVLTDLAGRARVWWRVEVGGAADQAAASTTAWPYVAVAGLVLMGVGGGLVLVLGGRWSGLHGRYEAPAAGTTDDSADLWGALDRGDDPTARDDADG